MSGENPKKRSRNILEPTIHEQRYAAETSTNWYIETRGIEQTALALFSRHTRAKALAEVRAAKKKDYVSISEQIYDYCNDANPEKKWKMGCQICEDARFIFCLFMFTSDWILLCGKRKT